MMQRRDSSVSTASSEGEISCLGAFCHLLCCLLCFRQMKSSTRIALTWFWVVIIAVVCGSVISKVYFTSTSVTLHPTDMRMIDLKSTAWCQSFKIDAYAPINTYLLDSEPTFKAETNRDVYTFRSSKGLHPGGYEYWDFYLLKKSVVSIKVCALHGPVRVVILKGESNFNKWVKHPTCSRCYEKRVDVDMCTYSLSGDLVVFNNDQNDRFYFVLLNNQLHGNTIVASLDFRLARTVYDLTEPVYACTQEVTCTVPLDDGYTESLVVYYPPNKDSKASTKGTVTAKCKPRFYLFLPICVFVPLCIALVITGIIVKRSRQALSRRRNSSEIFTISGSDRRSTSGIASQAFVLEPPAYAECCDAPPTYEEVLRIKNSQSES